MKSDQLAIILICFGVFIVYLASPVIPVSDSIYSVPQMLSLIYEGNDELSEYAGPYPTYHLDETNHGTYSSYPSGTIYLALPLGLLFSAIYGRAYITVHIFQFELIIASLLMVLATAMFYQIARMRLSVEKAILLTLFFALGTSVYSVGSRALWQQSGMIFLVVAFIRLVEWPAFRKHTLTYLLAGFLVGLSFVTRPLMAPWIIACSLYILFHRASGKQFLVFIVGGGLIAIAFFAGNYLRYDHFLPPYYRSGQAYVPEEFPYALVSVLFSPARGFFIWHPVFLMVIPAMIKSIIQPKRKSLLLFFIPAILAQIILVSLWPAWWGGHSVGPRLMAEITPMFCYAMIPLMTSLNPNTNFLKTLAVGLLAIIGTGIHMRGSMVTDVNEWNRTPIDINSDARRVWLLEEGQWFHKESNFSTLFKF